jgi:membrane protein implicated in regulation of membrane protease activity
LGNSVNWILIVVGLLFVIAELVLGAVTGFDLALVGASLTAGGAIGLFTGSAKVGMLASSALALIYFAIFRSWLRAKLTVKEHHSNVDAVVGKEGVVTKRIAPRDPGMININGEIWRAELVTADAPAQENGSTVTVVSVEGVTLKVR